MILEIPPPAKAMCISASNAWGALNPLAQPNLSCDCVCGRYNKETLAKMRIDYLIRFEEKLEAKKATLKTDSSDPKIRQKALNEQTKINKKLQEIRRYDEKLKHLADQYIEIDLDDGVKKNYKLFEEIIAKI